MQWHDQGSQRVSVALDRSKARYRVQSHIGAGEGSHNPLAGHIRPRGRRTGIVSGAW
jgi:hypothetical protein